MTNHCNSNNDIHSNDGNGNYGNNEYEYVIISDDDHHI